MNRWYLTSVFALSVMSVLNLSEAQMVTVTQKRSLPHDLHLYRLELISAPEMDSDVKTFSQLKIPVFQSTSVVDDFFERFESFRMAQTITEKCT